MAIILIIKTEDEQIAELPLLGKIVVGRSSSSDYKIDDTKMSSKHCSFEVTKKGEVLFCDVGSTNGSFLNNSQINQCHMRVNDVIRVGNTLIKIDEKKLTAAERIAIGNSKFKSRDDKTLPDMENLPNESDKTEAKKKTVVLGKNLKEKRRPLNQWSSRSEAVIEQEETGHTKFLKLDKNKKKKS